LGADFVFKRFEFGAEVGGAHDEPKMISDEVKGFQE
jgi:hypothetical protein